MACLSERSLANCKTTNKQGDTSTNIQSHETSSASTGGDNN